MAQGVHKITEDFEKALCDYTGAPYAVALDNMSNALFLALYYEKNIKKSLTDEKIDCPSKHIRQFPVKSFMRD
jgi:dTDP-4-amino-4,6-dideoxygalactose transaminase